MIKYRVCKTNKGYLTDEYFRFNNNHQKCFTTNIDKAYKFSETDCLDLDMLCDVADVYKVDFETIN